MAIHCFCIDLLNRQEDNKYIQKTGRQHVENKFHFF